MKTNFKKYGAFAIALVIANLFFALESFGQSQVFSTPGTFSGVNGFIVPAGVTSVTVEVWGGGGKGGSTTSIGHTGGGGGGAYSKKNIIAVTPGNSYTVVVGGGATTTSAGGDSYFIDISTVLAKGGNSVANNSANGVAGGSAASGVGDSKFSGGDGADGVIGQGGGGGSSAGTAHDGADGSSGTGGTAPTGGAKGGNGASTGNTPQAGSVPGGGGGGTSSTGSSSGGNGGNGKVIISWTVSVCPTITTSATKSDITCFNTNTGFITVNVPATGTSPFQYSIDNGAHYFTADGPLGYITGVPTPSFDAANRKFYNLPAGSYQVMVQDANGCKSKLVQ